MVTVVSTSGVGGIGSVKHRTGDEIMDPQTEICIREYQKYMGGVDRGDQIHKTSAVFCRKSLFKKWYKKVCFAVCDFMLLSSYLSWDLAVDSKQRHGKRHIRKCQFYSAFVEELIAFLEEDHLTNYQLDIGICDIKCDNRQETTDTCVGD